MSIALTLKAAPPTQSHGNIFNSFWRCGRALQHYFSEEHPWQCIVGEAALNKAFQKHSGILPALGQQFATTQQ
jgi:hypothetical protein